MPPSAYTAPLLRYWRDVLAVGQSELADAANTSPTTVRRLEHGGRTSVDVLTRLTAALEHYDAEAAGWHEPPRPADTIDLQRPLDARQRRWLGKR